MDWNCFLFSRISGWFQQLAELFGVYDIPLLCRAAEEPAGDKFLTGLMIPYFAGRGKRSLKHLYFGESIPRTVP